MVRDASCRGQRHVRYETRTRPDGRDRRRPGRPIRLDYRSQISAQVNGSVIVGVMFSVALIRLIFDMLALLSKFWAP